MGTHVFFQRFVAGKVAALPFKDVTSFLAGFGTLVRTDFDLELKFLQHGVIAQDGIDGYVTLIGDEATGISCMAIEQPLFAAAAEFCCALIERFDVALFDDALRVIFVKDQTGCILPQPMVAACASEVRPVASARQLWPSACVLPSSASACARLLPFETESGGQRYQLIDVVDLGANRLRYDINLHPAACSPATTRAMRHAMARVHRVCHLQRPARLEIFFNFHETCSAVLEAAKVGDVEWPTITVSPPPFAFDGRGAMAPPAPFAADRNADATARLNAARCSDAAASELGTPLSLEDDDFNEFARFVAVRRARLTTLAGQARQDLYAETLWFAGSHWGELIRRAVGGQWGYVELADGRHPTLQTYSGTRIFPLLDLVDCLCGASDQWLADRLKTLRRLRAPSLDHSDLVGDIHPYCALLCGHAEGFETIPLHDHLAVAELDYSLGSLVSLERWLRQFATHRHQFDTSTAIGVVHTAGAYFGEVIRAQAPTEWRWENYHDYFDGTPDLPDIPFEASTAAVLLGYGHLLFPLATIRDCIVDPSAPSLLDWLAAQFRETGVTWELPTAPRVESDDGEAYRLPVDPDRASGFAEHLVRIAAGSDFRFDFSAESIRDVDRFIESTSARKQGSVDAETSELIYLLACYAGEVMVRHYAARWRRTVGTRDAGRSDAAMLLETSGGSLVDPVGRAFALARRQGGESFARMAVRVGNEFQLRQRHPVAAEVAAANGAEVDRSLAGIAIADCVASLPPDERDYAMITPSRWLPSDPLAKVLQAAPTLLAHGRVVWAHIVQVNSELFAAPGINDNGRPGEVVYDPTGVFTPEQLAPIARRIFALRGTQASLDPTCADHEQLLALANHLDAETTRAFGMPVPPSLGRRSLSVSTLYFDRAHLPGGRVHVPHLPILIDERCPGVAMVLPGRWWPQALLEQIEARIDRARVDVWQTAWQKLAAGGTDEHAQQLAYRSAALQRYARVGTAPEDMARQLHYGWVPFRAGIEPAPFEWEWHLSSELDSYAERLLAEVETDRARGLPLNQSRACEAFAASALAQRIKLHRLLLCKRRGVDNKRLRLDPDHIQYTALGFAAGMDEAALEAARLSCLAWQFDGFYTDLMRPEVRAVFVLFAEQLALSIPKLEPFAPTPHLDALIDGGHWRSTDDDEFCSLLEAACAEHTRTAPTGPFQGLPAALLLIFKLRQLSGLSSVASSHPLFERPLQLPAPGSNDAAGGELLARVSERMGNHGFDPQRISQAMASGAPLVVDSNTGVLPVPERPPQIVHLGVQWIDNDETARLDNARMRRPALLGLMVCIGLALFAAMLLSAASDTARPVLWLLLVGLAWRGWRYCRALLN